MVGLIFITICALVGAGLMAWKMFRLKKDIYEFTDQMEKSLDAVICGKSVELKRETEDSLFGKMNEKLIRVNQIFAEKEQQSLLEKQKMKELISDISHQTKTPIANQKIYLDLMKQEKRLEENRIFIQKLESQTNKLDFLFQSMVKMSRLETGIIQIQKQKENLFQTIRKAVASVVPAAAKKQIEIFVDAEEKLSLQHDPKWTEEAVYNLLDNAVKYTKKGGMVRLQVTRHEIFTELSISDTGKGIPLERQAQIFSRFYREPEVYDQEGIGIGLYLARKIIELQSGYIEVHSKVGKGSDFRIYLPNP